MSNVFFTVYLCRLMRGKESTNGEYFVMLLPMSKTFPTLNSLNSFYLPIQLLLTRNKGNGTLLVLSCAAFIFLPYGSWPEELFVCLFTHGFAVIILSAGMGCS
jgi:hypothetical protein